MKKKKNSYKVLNDFNDIVEYLQDQRKKRDLEHKILMVILGFSLGLTIVIYFMVKGN